MVNPENGDFESSLAENFRIPGYPSIYLFEEEGSDRFVHLRDVLTVSGFKKSIKNANKGFDGGGDVMVQTAQF